MDDDIEVEEVEPGTSKDLVQTTTDTDLEEKLMNNPVIQKMMTKFFEDKFKDLQREQQQNQQNPSQAETGLNPMGFKQVDSGKIVGVSVNNIDNQGSKLVKSPSDTTIYVPALHKKLTPQSRNTLWLSEGRPDASSGQFLQGQGANQKDAINNFVEAVRMEQHPQDSGQRAVLEDERRFTNLDAADLEQAQKRAGKAIIEAEKYKANVEQPGTSNFLSDLFQKI